jgi:hypothetical protein
LRITDFAPANGSALLSLTWLGGDGDGGAWLAPEQARGEPATSASDVRALGACIVAATLSGPRSQHGSAGRRGQPTAIDAALEDDPRNRPTARDLADALAAEAGRGPEERGSLSSRLLDVLRRRRR